MVALVEELDDLFDADVHLSCFAEQHVDPLAQDAQPFRTGQR